MKDVIRKSFLVLALVVSVLKGENKLNNVKRKNRMSGIVRGLCTLLFLVLIANSGTRTVEAVILLHQPVSGAEFTAEACPHPLCHVPIEFGVMFIPYGNPLTSDDGVELRFERQSVPGGSTHTICFRWDHIEQNGGDCPTITGGSSFFETVNLSNASSPEIGTETWTVVAKVLRSGVVTETSNEISVIVHPWEPLVIPGPVSLSEVRSFTPLKGLVRAVMGSVILRGDGTSFNTELSVWDSIRINNEDFTVTAIQNDEELTLGALPASGLGISNATAYKPDDLFYPSGTPRFPSGSPKFLLRDPVGLPEDPGYVPGVYTIPGIVDIIGENLHNNQFLSVYTAPIYDRFDLQPESSLPVQDWCLQPDRQSDGLEILRTDVTPSTISVELPELPFVVPSICSDAFPQTGNTFSLDWRFVIHDEWGPPTRDWVHEWWAISTPRLYPWHDAPPFRMVMPDYPLINGFGFFNHQREFDTSYYEFLTVYGNNAYKCLSVAGQCISPRIINPIYIGWYEIYDAVMGGTGGSCVGMCATSMLMSHEEIQTEEFESDVHFPYGFDTPGPDSTLVIVYEADGVTEDFRYMGGVSKYSKPDWCTATCSPPRPDNLWATIRKNHGVQFSMEFLQELIDNIGEAIFDPNDLSTIKGQPNATLERIRSDPGNYALTMYNSESGHCVTPYKVDEEDRIWVYDNNYPGDNTQCIQIANGIYSYVPRPNDPNNEANRGGTGISAWPIDLWKNGRHLPGIGELTSIFNGDIVAFLTLIVVGSADMLVTNTAGGRWGLEDDGSFADSMFGALAIPILGPSPNRDAVLPLLVAMNQPAPEIQITSADNSKHYYFSTGAGGHLFQLEASDALEGDKDHVQLGYAGEVLDSFDFTPQRDASHFVPRIGLELSDEGSAVFHWLGFEVPGGSSVGFSADKQAGAVTYHNDTGDSTYHVLAMDYGSGTAQSSGRMIYGPFEVPAGADQRVVLASWPDVTDVVSELDLNRDGVPDNTEVVTGNPVTSPIDLGSSADLSVTKSADLATVSLGEDVTYTVTVTNEGPDDATDVMLVDLLPQHAGIYFMSNTHGTCTDYDGLSCNLDIITAGDTAIVTYIATPTLPGTLANVATVLGNEGDSDLTNNSAMTTTEVIDTTPPTISATVSPGTLWPANHKMVDVVIQANANDNSGSVTLSATVVSSEPPDTDGDGNTIPDYTTPVIDQSTQLITLQLRAERKGQGTDRTYAITVTATDGSGNSSDAIVEVVVPHDKGKKK